MIGPNSAPQFILTVLAGILAVLVIVLQFALLKTPDNIKNYRALRICEVVASVCIFFTIVGLVIAYWEFIPANSPGCLPFISEFGVVASGVDPTAFAVKPLAPIPAFSYEAAVAAYKKSPNGLATGYFAWDGVSVLILTSAAHQLNVGTPTGTSWVFQDLSRAVA